MIAIRVGKRRREEEKYVLNFKRVQVHIYLLISLLLLLEDEDIVLATCSNRSSVIRFAICSSLKFWTRGWESY